MKKLIDKEDLTALLYASSYSLALGAAIETGLVQILAEKPIDAKSIVKALDIPGKRGYYWLQILQELGILEMTPEGFALSQLIITTIVETKKLERWKHLANDERELLAGTRNLALYLSEPGSIWKIQGLKRPNGYVEKMNDDPERAREFTYLLYNLHQDLGIDLAEILNLTDIHNMLDVGGSSGVISIPFVKKNPSLKSTVVDIKNVCEAGQEIIQEIQLSDRISFFPANFVTDELPKGFDLVLYCDIGVFGEDLFRKLSQSLNSEGLIVVVFQFPPTETSAPIPYLRWAFQESLIDPDFGFPTVSQVQEQLIRSGFHLLPEVHTLTDGQIIIQAKKN